MTAVSSHDDSVAGLAELLRARRGAVLTEWQQRIGSLPACDGPSLVTDGQGLLDWLITSLDEHSRGTTAGRGLPGGASFTAFSTT